MRSLLAGILVLRAATSAAPAPQTLCASNAVALGEAIARVHEKQKNVGLAVAVAHDSKVIFTEYRGFADLEHEVPVSRETRFAIASITKAFTGAALLKLWERGAIDLDAPIQRYVPSFPVKSEGKITPRLLAAHFAGIRHWKDERTPELYARHFEEVSQILPLFQDDPLVAAPGTKYSYSSYGYDLLGAAIENAGKRRYTEFVQENILQPLKLDATGFDDVRRVLPHRARRYSYYDLSNYAEQAELVRVPDWDYSHNLAAGNMISTAEDLVRFGSAFTGPGFLSAGAWQLLYTRPRTEQAVSPMSFGWFVSEKDKSPREIHTSGSNPGVQAALYVFPDHAIVVAVLSNTWGIDSRSGEMVSELPREIGRLCGAQEPHPPQP
jgi:serine beta-lactamase-like protein LACTB, mitochondrial